MQLSRSSRSLTAWIASIAILLAALAPAISQAAYRASGDASWLEICTAYGMERVRVDGQPDPDGDTVKGTGKLCVYCSFFVGALPPPSAPNLMPSVPAGTDVLGTAPLEHPRPLVAWAASRARAPPSLA